VHGFEFAKLLSAYYRAYVDGDDGTKAKVVRWFRGEYTLKSEARNELGVNMVITDDDWYDYLKLFATFFRLAGYTGMMIMIDELVNIYKITHSVTRQNNYEKMLTMYNDTLQGKARYLGIIMGATPQALEDRRRGIYSYEALRSRLAEGRFSKPGARDLLAPVIHLEPLTAEEMLVVLAEAFPSTVYIIQNSEVKNPFTWTTTKSNNSATITASGVTITTQFDSDDIITYTATSSSILLNKYFKTLTVSLTTTKAGGNDSNYKTYTITPYVNGESLGAKTISNTTLMFDINKKVNTLHFVISDTHGYYQRVTKITNMFLTS
jgi:hypothetical protein